MTRGMREIISVIDDPEAADGAHGGTRSTVKRSNDVCERMPAGVIIVWYESALKNTFFGPTSPYW